MHRIKAKKSQKKFEKYFLWGKTSWDQTFVLLSVVKKHLDLSKSSVKIKLHTYENEKSQTSLYHYRSEVKVVKLIQPETLVQSPSNRNNLFQKKSIGLRPHAKKHLIKKTHFMLCLARYLNQLRHLSATRFWFTSHNGVK